MNARDTEVDTHVYSFGSFRLTPGRQLLTRDDVPVRIGTRAFYLLAKLVSQAGHLVSKDELMASAWPNTFVHESNLKVTISALRRALNEQRPDNVYINTVPGRGYCFVAPVKVSRADADWPPHGSSTHPLHRLPSIPHVIGRSGELKTISDILSAARLATIVGAGGVGKTTLATAVARRLATESTNTVRFIDLTGIADPRLVPEVIASQFEGRTAHTDPLVPVIDVLRSQPTLLVLDNCEHVLNAAAVASERLLANTEKVQILATSREPMRLSNEEVYRLAPLPSPAVDVDIAARQAMATPSVELFVTRAAEKSGYELTDQDAPIICEICRQLDGIPLALELAATRLGMFGPADLLAGLRTSLRILSRERGTAPVRQRTLFATLDWSYNLLSDAEATVLRSLSTFAGYFTLDGAVAVSLSDNFSAERVIASIEALVNKSLITTVYRGGALRYRLLESTREYASGCLQIEGEQTHALRRHAQYHLDLFEQAEREWASRDRSEWVSTYAPRIDDVRKALSWAFGRDGDETLGIRLATAALPLWQSLPSFSECRTWVSQALKAMVTAGIDDPELKMKLTAAKAWVKVFAQVLVPETERDWNCCLALADRLADTDFQLRARWGLAVHLVFTGRHHDALDQLSELQSIANETEDWDAYADGERLTGYIEFHIGRLADANERLDQLAKRPVGAGKRSRLQPYQDRAVLIRASRAPALWVLGYPDKAARVAQEGVEGARSEGHLVSLSNVLATAAVPISLWRGDLDAAESYLGLLRASATRQGLSIWHPICRFFEGALLDARGQSDGVDVMQDAVGDLIEGRFVLRLPLYLGMLAEARSARNQPGLAEEAARTALERITTLGECWCQPEILRILGLIRMHQGEFEQAESMLQRSLAESAAMGAGSWQLRTSVELCKLWLAQDRAKDAYTLLEVARRKFREGGDTADLRAADALIGGTGARCIARCS